MTSGNIVAGIKAPYIENSIEAQIQMRAFVVKMFKPELVSAETFDFDVYSNTFASYPHRVDDDVPPQYMSNFSQSGKVAWAHYTMFMSDAEKLRAKEANRWGKTMAEASKTQGIVENNHILGALMTAAHADNTVAASTPWVDGGEPDPAAKIEQELTQAISLLQTNMDMDEQDDSMSKVHVFLPDDTRAPMKLQGMYDNISISLKKYFENSFEVQFHFSRDRTDSRAVTAYNLTAALGDDALLFPEFAGSMDNVGRLHHFDPAEARARGVPYAEFKRIEMKGDSYMTRRAFVFTATQADSTATTNYNIGKISDVRTT